jgi:hypothetical protein
MNLSLQNPRRKNICLSSFNIRSQLFWVLIDSLTPTTTVTSATAPD